MPTYRSIRNIRLGVVYAACLRSSSPISFSLKSLCLILSFVGPAVTSHAQETLNSANSEADRIFTLKVKPILAEKCFSCHGDDPDEIESGLIMHTREDLLLGGDGFGDVLVSGDAEPSFMMTAIKWEDPDYEMPPKENDRLTEGQIWVLRDWINDGAVWPDDDTQEVIRQAEKERLVTYDGMLVENSGGLSDDWTLRCYQPEDLWAYQALKVSEEPDKTNPLDSFINEKLNDAGITPAPEAEPRVLIRRLSFDLIGLPPSPEEIEHFQKAWKKDKTQAYETLIDRLLASPHYGERQAQHWLDVTRYADTSGGSNDFERSGVWRYRDYVVRSFNKDKPYDQFIREQIAGDELNPGDPEGAVAAGFLWMGPFGNRPI